MTNYMLMSSMARHNRTITYAQAIYEATRQEMERDDSVFVLGLNVDDARGLYGTTLDLHKTFGRERSFDTPLSEDAMTGVAIGAALAGARPIHVHQRMDFLLLCMNQLINLGAKSSYMFSGAVSVPIVVRAIIGRSWGQGAQHSQALHSYFMHVPGIRVAAPATPHDAKGCLITAIRDNNPVIFMEHRMLYGITGIVPEESYEVPFGQARTLVHGDDVTIVGISHMVVECVRAKHILEEVDIAAEVIDPITLTPIDIDTIAASVERTGHLLIVDNGWTTCGAASEIIAAVVERLQGKRELLVKRIGYAPTPCPTTKPLENLFYPTAHTIAVAAYNLMKHSEPWQPRTVEASEIAEFKGPF
jgi:acetoin:2,6-dichlorophenolindophenol oxidoreductase subunit beta